MIIAVDFDGTCVKHEYPHIGADIGAVPVLKKITTMHQLVLFTMRSGKELEDAVQWFADNSIRLDGVQKSLWQELWTDSPKCYANLYIDDAALGCPVLHDAFGRDYVNWQQVETMLKIMCII
jgi:hypothetical protein